MRLSQRICFPALFLILLLGAGDGMCGARITKPIMAELEAIPPMVKGAPINMRLNLRVAHAPFWEQNITDSGTITVTYIQPRAPRDTLSVTTYPIQYTDSATSSMVFQTIVPEMDTVKMRVRYTCGSFAAPYIHYFTTEGDKVVFHPEFHMPRINEGMVDGHQAKRRANIDRDTLTEVHLSKMIEVAIDLRTNKNLHIAEKILGYIPIKYEITNQKGLYILWMTLGEVYQLIDAGIDGDGVREFQDNFNELLRRDTLTNEQLQTEYEVIMNLRNPGEKSEAETIIGDIPDSCLYDSRHSFYIVTTTLDHFLKLVDRQIDLDFVSPPPWSNNYRPPRKIQQQKPPASDATDLQGIIEHSPNQRSPGGISVDSIVPLTASGKLPTDQSISFYLHIKNHYSTKMYATSNGFRIYSPDGASWASLTADTLPTGLGNMIDVFVVNTYGSDGYDVDTVGFGGVTFFGTGLLSGFDATAFTITIGPIDNSMAGKTICLDSCFFGESGTWMWVDEYEEQLRPPWSGQTCYEIEGPTTIDYSGYLYYESPAPADTSVPPSKVNKPMRAVKIEMWDGDLISDDYLATCTTDNYGHFEMVPVENSDAPGELDIYFKIFAQNDACYVTANYESDIVKIQSPTQNNLPSGQYDTTIIASINFADTLRGAFMVADAILEGQNVWHGLTGLRLDPIQVILSSEQHGSYYQKDSTYIKIESRGWAIFYYPHTYDRYQILHEYGHYIAYTNDFFDSTIGGAHSFGDTTSIYQGSAEGFADFFSCVAMGESLGILYADEFEYCCVINFENGQISYSDTSLIYILNNLSEKCEVTVAGILWDIYDDADDDYSWYPTFWGYHPDGIGDSLSDGMGNILDVLFNQTVNGHHPDNIGEFWTAWFQVPVGHSRALQDIWYEHGIDNTFICGDANSDGLVNTGDIAFLVNYTFKSGPAPVPLESGEVNCDGLVNVGDIKYLVNFVFITGPDPCAGCEKRPFPYVVESR